MHHAPVSVFLAEYHRRARDVLVAVPARTHRRFLTDPIRASVAMAPDHRQLIRDDAADVKRGPIAARDVVLIELPEPRPMRAAVIGVAVEIEEDAGRIVAPDPAQGLRVERPVRNQIAAVELQQALPVAVRPAVKHD